MADPAKARDDAGAAVHDGRFGAHFDDEISTRGVVQTLVGVLAMAAVAMVLMIFLWRLLDRDAAAAERALPAGPLLQPRPEAELVLLRREMADRLGSYGWVDQGAGIVHIPIEQAIEVVLARGLPSRPVDPAAAPGESEVVSDPADPGDAGAAEPFPAAGAHGAEGHGG